MLLLLTYFYYFQRTRVRGGWWCVPAGSRSVGLRLVRQELGVLGTASVPYACLQCVIRSMCRRTVSYTALQNEQILNNHTRPVTPKSILPTSDEHAIRKAKAVGKTQRKRCHSSQSIPPGTASKHKAAKSGGPDYWYVTL